MRNILKNMENPIVFDVGANVGHHTLFAASIGHKVHSFEPYGVVADQLWDKITSNGIQHVTLHRFGLGNENQFLHFDAPKNCNTGTGKFVTDSVNSNDASGGEILEVRRGDDVVRELSLDALHFIKIDVEGFEVEVLKGLRETLARFRPLVFFEWNQAESGVTAFEPWFPENYEFFTFEPTPVFLFFFCSGTYRLQRLAGAEVKLRRADGANFLAVPCEKSSGL